MVYNDLKFEKMIADNGKEFDNNSLKEWCNNKHISLDFVIPYYHQGNGRIERANRTIRDALKRTSGPINCRLNEVVRKYNDQEHRGIGMEPNKAIKEENFNEVRKRAIAYSKEFKTRKLGEFNIGDQVLIKNETKKTKMDKEFDRKGEVVEKIGANEYIVFLKHGKVLRRHTSQLRNLAQGS